MMKKLCFVVAVLCCLALLGGCGQANATGAQSESTAPGSTSVQIPNPIHSVESAEDFAPLNIALQAPENAKDVRMPSSAKTPQR